MSPKCRITVRYDPEFERVAYQHGDNPEHALLVNDTDSEGALNRVTEWHVSLHEYEGSVS